MRRERLTPKRFWDRIDAASRVAELKGARFDDDSADKRLRRMAKAVVLPEYFNRTYLPHYFRDEGCGLHTLIHLGLEQSEYTVVRAPRGHGKTTGGTFSYGLHQVACGDVLRQWEQGTLQRDQPELHQAIVDVIREEVERRLEAGRLSCDALGIPEHWDPEVTDRLNDWLAEVYERIEATRTIPLHWDPYIQVVAIDSDTAIEFTAAMRVELEQNPLLRADWGDLTPCKHTDWNRSVKRAASDGDWTSNDVRVRAFGMNQSLRGGKHGAWRPTLLLGDDPDSEESTRTQLQRDRNINKLRRAAGAGLDERKRRVMMVGTPVDSDCIVCRLSEHDQYQVRWTSIRVRARDEHGTILYPAKWTARALDAEEYEDPEGYGSELDDRPPADGDSPFEELHYYSRADFEGVRLAKALVFDPSLGRRKTSDYQALVHLRGPTKSGEFLVDLVELMREPDVVRLSQRVNGIRGEVEPDIAAVETIGFQSLMEVVLAAEGERMGLLDNWARIESHDEGKDLRIRGLARLSNKAKLLWPDDGSCRAGERQARSYPKGKVDGLDAIEMGVRLLRRGQRGSLKHQVRHHPGRRAGFAGARDAARPGAW